MVDLASIRITVESQQALQQVNALQQGFTSLAGVVFRFSESIEGVDRAFGSFSDGALTVNRALQTVRERAREAGQRLSTFDEAARAAGTALSGFDARQRDTARNARVLAQSIGLLNRELNQGRISATQHAGALAQLRQAYTQVGAAAQTAGGQISRSNRSFGDMTTAAFLLRGALSGLGVTLSARAFVEQLDVMSRVENQLRLVTGSASELRDAQSQLFEVAQRTYTPFEATAQLYTRLSRSTENLGLSQSDLLDITERVTQAYIISGTTAREAASSITQFTQGLAAGALRGDEFNSVAEGAPPIMRALQRELDMTQGELREFASEGGITTEIMISAIQNMGDEWDSQFQRIERTVDNAVTQFVNDFQRLVGGADEATDVSRTIVEAFDQLRETINDPAFAQGFSQIVELIGMVVKAGADAVAQLGRLNAVVQELGAAASEVRLPEGIGQQALDFLSRTGPGMAVRGAFNIGESLGLWGGTELEEAQRGLAELQLEAENLRNSLAQSEAELQAIIASGGEGTTRFQQVEATVAGTRSVLEDVQNEIRGATEETERLSKAAEGVSFQQAIDEANQLAAVSGATGARTAAMQFANQQEVRAINERNQLIDLWERNSLEAIQGENKAREQAYNERIRQEEALERKAQSAARAAARRAEREAKRRQEAIEGNRREGAEYEKLAAALKISQQAHDDLAMVLEAENAARQAGFDLQTEAGRAYADEVLLTLRRKDAYEDLKDAIKAADEAVQDFIKNIGVPGNLSFGPLPQVPEEFDFSGRQRGFWESFLEGPGPRTIEGTFRPTSRRLSQIMATDFGEAMPAGLRDSEDEFKKFTDRMIENLADGLRDAARDFISQMRQGILTDIGDAFRAVFDTLGRAADEIVASMVFNPRLMQQAWGAGGWQRAGMAGAFGMVGGGALSSALGLSNTGGQFGGGLGAAVGSMFGPAGAIGGGLLGSLLGGGLGSIINGPRAHPVASASIAFDARGTPFIMGTGAKHMSAQEAAAFGQQGVSAVQGIGQAFGGTLTGRAAFQIGMDDGRARLSTARGVEYFATVEAALSALTRRLIEIPGAIAGMNEGLRRAALNSGLAGDALLQYVSALRQQVDAAHAQIRLWNTGDLTQGEQAVRAIHEQWSAMAPALREVGEGTAALSAAAEGALARMRGEFISGVRRDIAALGNPRVGELNALRDWLENTLRDAVAYGGGQTEVWELFYARRAEIERRYAEEALQQQQAQLQERFGLLEAEGRLEQQRLNSFRQAQEQVRQTLLALQTGPQSFLTPWQQLNASQVEFERIRQQVQGGDVEAIGDLNRVAQTYIEQARLFDPNTGRDVFARVTEILRGIANVQAWTPADMTERIVEATRGGAQEVVNALWGNIARMIDAINMLRADNQNVARELRAIAAR